MNNNLIKQKSIYDLHIHPKNEYIYGENEDISDLIDSISKYSIKCPLIINSDNLIISGNRRYRAALKLGFKEIPVIVKSFDSKEDELLSLIIDNTYRIKTVEQKVREGLVLEEIEKERARKRMGGGIKVDYEETGKVADIIAAKVGFNSGRQYDRAKHVVKKIDDLIFEDHCKDAELLKYMLDKAPSTANEFVNKVDLSQISNETKENILKGEVRPHSLIRRENKISEIDLKRKHYEHEKEMKDSKQNNNGVFVDDIFKEFNEMKLFLNSLISSDGIMNDITYEDQEDIKNVLKNFEQAYFDFKKYILN